MIFDRLALLPFVVGAALLGLILPSSAEQKEKKCSSNSLWYDTRLAVNMATDNGSCIFEALIVDATATEAGSRYGSLIVDAWRAADGSDERRATVQKAQVEMLEAVKVLASDVRFAPKGGNQLVQELQSALDDVQQCTEDALAGKEYTNGLPSGLSLKCWIDPKQNTFTMVAAYSEVQVELQIPLLA